MLKWLLFACFTLLSANEQKLFDAVIEGRLEYFRAGSVNSPHPAAAFHKVGGSYVYVSGIHYPMWNGVIGSDKEPDPEKIQMAIGYFNSLNLPFMWWTNADLGKYGFTFGGILNGVAIDLENNFPEAPANTVDVRVVNSETINTFSAICAGVFEMEYEVFNQSMNESMLHGDMVHFLAYVDDKPAGTVTLNIGSTAGIWGLATLSEYRKQGIATALVYAALKEAKTRNIPTAMAILMPKGMAWNLLAKLGFKSYHQFPFYIYGYDKELED